MDKKPNATKAGHSTQPPRSKNARLSPMKTDAPATVSWITERDILRKFGDRRTRAILAVLTARRSSGCLNFFIPPHIAALFNLTPKDLCWALKDLEGKLIATRSSCKGKFRKVCLLPEWEGRAEAERTRVTMGKGPGSVEDELTGTSINETEVAATLRELAQTQPGRQ